ncbi:PLDc N-terminal domain-containing protein [Tsukamurella sp. 8F]|nr:PLDc N-terminal domain-containing protein [Tsukamurella sp. 8F]MDF0586367.1 PLDc N-terminal domain-containing protein [Tsukamurella sp. 8F]
MSILLIATTLLFIAAIGVFVAALVSVLAARFAEPVEKLVWVIVVLVLPVLGPVLWFAWGRGARTVRDSEQV